MRDPLISRRSFMAAGASWLAWQGPSQRVQSDAVEAVVDESALHTKTDGRSVFDFRLRADAPDTNIRASFLRAGYLHPVFTPSGSSPDIAADTTPGIARTSASSRA